MATSGYLSVSGVEDALRYLVKKYPDLCQYIPLPEPTAEGRTTAAVRIGTARRTANGLLLLGGAHAREIVNPELLVRFALQLCAAYQARTGLRYGGKSYSTVEVHLIIDSVHVYLFPQVNPDGRAFVFSSSGDPWWRKNRRPSTSGCIGVDLNRNFDFLWSSGIGTSANPCDYQVYRGSSAFSEAETKNVRYLLDTFPIDVMADVHSFSQLILYPWGDDDNQSTTAEMNFRNPAYDGMRGAIGDNRYREFIPSGDLRWCMETAGRIKSAIWAVRGRSYTAEPGAGLYPTSGTSNDYAYSRHFGTGRREVRAFCIETGTEFQPSHEEGVRVMDDVSAGLVELCLASVCIVEAVATAAPLAAHLASIRRFRDTVLLDCVPGRDYVALLEEYNRELLAIVSASEAVRGELLKTLEKIITVVATFDSPQPARFDAATIALARALIKSLYAKASPSLRLALRRVDRDVSRFAGKTVIEGLRSVPRPETSPAKRKTAPTGHPRKLRSSSTGPKKRPRSARR